MTITAKMTHFNLRGPGGGNIGCLALYPLGGALHALNGTNRSVNFSENFRDFVQHIES